MLINLSFSFFILGLVLALLLPLLCYIIDYNDPYEGVPAIICLSGFCIILSLFFHIIGGV